MNHFVSHANLYLYDAAAAVTQTSSMFSCCFALINSSISVIICLEKDVSVMLLIGMENVITARGTAASRLLIGEWLLKNVIKLTYEGYNEKTSY